MNLPEQPKDYYKTFREKLNTPRIGRKTVFYRETGEEFCTADMTEKEIAKTRLQVFFKKIFKEKKK